MLLCLMPMHLIVCEEVKVPTQKRSLLKKVDLEFIAPEPIVKETTGDVSEAVGEDGEALSNFLRQMKDHNSKVVRPTFSKRRPRKAA